MTIRLILVVVLLACVSLTGCATDDEPAMEDAGGGSVDAAATTHEDAGGDASEDAGGDASADPDGGTDADAGTDRDAGGSAATGELPAEIVRTCETTVACHYGPEAGTTFEPCLEKLVKLWIRPWDLANVPEQFQRITREIECANSAADCDAYVECATLNTPPCTSAAISCDGDHAVSCTAVDMLPYVLDCEALGLTCEPNMGCIPPPAATACATISFAPRCDGTGIVRCAPRPGGGGEHLDPCVDGLGCRLVATGVTGSFLGCGPETQTCTADGFTCDGDKLLNCNTGLLTEIDCAAAGLTCGMKAPGVLDCLAKTPTCVWPPAMSSAGLCEPSGDITTCTRGLKQTLHCADYDRSGCTTQIASSCGE